MQIRKPSILLLFSLGFAITATIAGLTNEFYVDVQSGVRIRGFPVGAMKFPAYWESPRTWRVHKIGFAIDVLFWLFIAYGLGNFFIKWSDRKKRRLLRRSRPFPLASSDHHR
jgi:hypothetical protein